MFMRWLEMVGTMKIECGAGGIKPGTLCLCSMGLIIHRNVTLQKNIKVKN